MKKINTNLPLSLLVVCVLAGGVLASCYRDDPTLNTKPTPEQAVVTVESELPPTPESEWTVIESELPPTSGEVTVKLEDLEADHLFGPLWSVHYGICDDTINGDAPYVLGMMSTDSNTSLQLHYHANCNLALYNLKGNVTLLLGPNLEEDEWNAGEWLYVPKGEIYGIKETGGPYSAYFCYVDIGDKEEAGTVLLEASDLDSFQGGTNATLIRETRADWEYEAPLYIGLGIDNTVVENPGMVMGVSSPAEERYDTPPTRRALRPRHYHANADATTFAPGRGNWTYAPKLTPHGEEYRTESTVAIDPNPDPDVTDWPDYVFQPYSGVVFCYPWIESLDEIITVMTVSP